MKNRMKPYLNEANASGTPLPSHIKEVLDTLGLLAALEGRSLESKHVDGGVELTSKKSEPLDLAGKDIRITIEAAYHNPASKGVTSESLSAFVTERLGQLLREFAGGSCMMLSIQCSTRESKPIKTETETEVDGAC